MRTEGPNRTARLMQWKSFVNEIVGVALDFHVCNLARSFPVRISQRSDWLCELCYLLIIHNTCTTQAMERNTFGALGTPISLLKVARSVLMNFAFSHVMVGSRFTKTLSSLVFPSPRRHIELGDRRE